jgi:branched-chain amino acid transport system substrate-binding protein
MRMQLMIEALVQALERAAQAPGTSPGRLPATVAIARELEKADVTMAGQRLTMRAADHQAQQTLMVSIMDRQGAQGVPFDVEGSGYGFRVIRQIEARAAEMPHQCQMVKP